MSNVNDLYELIQDIVYEETTYLRHYIGKVVDNLDPLKKGRVKITIPELGLDTPDLALWCWPRQGSGMSIPAIEKYAEVYFINGDRTKGAYLYPASEIIDNVPTTYKGTVTKHVLFESPENVDYINYDDKSGDLEIKLKNELKILGQAITMLEGTEAFVLGNALNTFLSNLIIALNTHVHTGVTTGAGNTGTLATPLSPPSGILSSVIKGK